MTEIEKLSSINSFGEMLYMFNKLLNYARENEKKINDYRKQIHQYAEIGFNTDQTVNYIKKKLKSFNIDLKKCGTNGIIATIGKNKTYTVLLRADMDALPLKEESGLPYSAQNGNCHACGHDLHTAMLLGAAKILKENENNLNGTVKLIFQPSEETLEGCKNMIENGLLNDTQTDAAIMIHVLTGVNLETGTVIVSSGGVSAPSADFFEINITGKSSHGSSPQKGIDALCTAAHTVINLQNIQTRELPSDHNSILTIGQLISGKAANIIADNATIKGTLRAFNEKIQDFIIKRIIEISENTAKAFRANAVFKITSSCPTLLNDDTISKLIGESLKNEYDKVLFSEELGEAIGGSEDFSYLTHKVPSLMLSIAAGNINEGYNYPLHHPKVLFDENVLPIGSAVYAYSAIKILENKKSGAI